MSAVWGRYTVGPADCEARGLTAVIGTKRQWGAEGVRGEDTYATVSVHVMWSEAVCFHLITVWELMYTPHPDTLTSRKKLKSATPMNK